MRIFGPGMSWDILEFGWIGGEFDILLGKQQEYETKYAGCWKMLEDAGRLFHGISIHLPGA